MTTAGKQTGTLSSLEIDEYTHRPTPVNVELLHMDPIKLKPENGDRVGTLVVSSFISLRDVQFVSNFLLRAAFYLGIPAKGPTPLKRKYDRWTVIKSPFAQAKSKQNFERLTHSREIKLFDANPGVLQVLFAIASKHTMAGVAVHAEMYSQESPDDLANSEQFLVKEIENFYAQQAQQAGSNSAVDSGLTEHDSEEAVANEALKWLNEKKRL